MKSFSKHFYMFPIVSIAAILLLICSQPLMAEKGKMEISFMTWTASYEPLEKLYRKAVADFEKLHPDIKVKYIGLPTGSSGAVMEKIFITAAGGVAPDVMVIPFDCFLDVAQSGILENLGPFLEKDKSVKKEDWFPGALYAGQWQGMQLALPYTGSALWVLYNADYIEECGLETPEDLAKRKAWNFQSMIELAQKTTKIGPQGRFEWVGIWTAQRIQFYMPWIWGMGGSVFDQSGTRCSLDSEGAIKGIALLNELLNKKKVLSFSSGTGGAQGGPVSGFAMRAWWRDIAADMIARGATWSMGAVPFPPGPASPKTVVNFIHTVGIWKESKVKDAAWEFVKYLTGKEFTKSLVTDIQATTWRRDSLAVMQEGMIAKRIAGAAFMPDSMERLRVCERSISFATATAEIDKGLANIWSQKSSPEAYLPELTKQVNALLENAAKKK